MLENCEIVLAPSHVYLDAVGKLLSNSHVSLSSQDISMFPSGAHTGEVSAEMVLDIISSGVGRQWLPQKIPQIYTVMRISVLGRLRDLQ